MECHPCNPCNCPTPPDFIERNGTWLLGVVGIVMTCMGGVFTFFLKSRCHHIKLCCAEFERTPMTLSPQDVEIHTTRE